MAERVNGPQVGKRRYDATGRQRAAALNRIRILDAARHLFTTDGYAATTVAAIARHAGVVPDTVYAAVGPKPLLFRELVELALSGADTPVPGAEREYVARMRAEPRAETKLEIYAQAVTEIQVRLAPLFLALREAAAGEPQLAQLWREISDRRAANMRLLAAELAATGRLRADLTTDEVADIIWSTNSAEYYAALVTERGWSPRQFAQWLGAAWRRLLLADR